MPDWLMMSMALIGIPVYLYLIARILSSAIARSVYEVKWEFANKHPSTKTQEVI